MEPSTEVPRVFSASKNLVFVSSVFLAFVFPISTASLLHKASWAGVMALGIGAALLAYLLLVRLELQESGLRVRTLFGWRSIDFDAGMRASIDILSKRRGRGCATLLLSSKNGRRVRIYLRHFPIEASVAMFRAIDSRGIEIALPDEKSRYWAEQIAAASAKGS